MKPLKNLMKNENAMLLGVLIVCILVSDKLKPVADNMLGKLVLLLAICYLANKHVVLGLLGALLYISLNNTLLEGNTEGEANPAEDEETEVVDEPEPPADDSAGTETFKEGNDDCDPENEDCNTK